MKLWLKISLISGIVLVMIVSICNILIIGQSKSTILDLAYQQAADKQLNLATAFSEMMSYYSGSSDSQLAKRTLAIYCFSRFADSHSVLVLNDEVLYSYLNIAPNDYLTLKDSYNQESYVGETDGRNIIIWGSQNKIAGMRFSVYTLEDITPVYQNVLQTSFRFILISLVGIVMGLIVTALLVYRSILPLEQLGKTAKHISQGNYRERAIIHSHDEVGSLAEDFNIMATSIQKHIIELTEITERQRLFIGSVAHEFKTPLTAMLLSADTLKNTYLEEEEKQSTIEHISKQCKWLETLTQKLLKLITMNEHIKLEQNSVSMLFEKTKDCLSEILEQRKTPLQMECNISILKMDRDLMLSALVNLVDNASKASEPGQFVFLRAYERTLEVQDYGCGISQTELTRITEPFYMIDKSRSKKTGGSGLGLALVKEIVEAHGAKLEFESVLGRGTIARIYF